MQETCSLVYLNVSAIYTCFTCFQSFSTVSLFGTKTTSGCSLLSFQCILFFFSVCVTVFHTQVLMDLANENVHFQISHTLSLHSSKRSHVDAYPAWLICLLVLCTKNLLCMVCIAAVCFECFQHFQIVWLKKLISHWRNNESHWAHTLPSAVFSTYLIIALFYIWSFCFCTDFFLWTVLSQMPLVQFINTSKMTETEGLTLKFIVLHCEYILCCLCRWLGHWAKGMDKLQHNSLFLMYSFVSCI